MFSTVTISQVEYGEFEGAGENGKVSQRENTVVSPQKSKITFTHSGNQIVAKVGKPFGFRFRFDETPAKDQVSVRIERSHPPILGEDGKVVTGGQRKFVLDLKHADPIIHDGFQFIAEKYFVEGDWVYKVFIDEELVFQKIFHVDKQKKSS